MVKHSKAQKGFVSLVEKNEMILLSIEDDGIGFETEKKGWFGPSHYGRAGGASWGQFSGGIGYRGRNHPIGGNSLVSFKTI